MKRRNTIQKSIIENAIHKLSHPTADEIYQEIKKDYPDIAVATVYRNLALMAEEGQLLKVTQGTADRFDINTHAHYHLRCTVCGKISDVNIPYLSELDEKLSKMLSQDIKNHSLEFYGICTDCLKNKNN